MPNQKPESNGALRIERGIPMPTNGKWEIVDELEVGDSVMIPRSMYSQTSALSAALGQRALRKGYKIAVRTVEGGARVWRIE
jgi:hypothetical protein